jgi:hypothetical protein
MGKKIRFRFSKTGAFKYLSHLDTAKVIIRAVRRAGIRLKYSEGFNPKPKITFSPPIPLGIESIAEYADITLMDDMDIGFFMEVINHNLDGRIIISSAAEVPAGVKNLMSQVDIAGYEIEILENLTGKHKAIGLSEKVLGNPGIKDTVYEMCAEENSKGNGAFRIMVYGYTKTSKGRNEKVFKLRDFLGYLEDTLKACGMNMGRIQKKELYILKDGKRLTPFEVFQFYV